MFNALIIITQALHKILSIFADRAAHVLGWIGVFAFAVYGAAVTMQDPLLSNLRIVAGFTLPGLLTQAAGIILLITLGGGMIVVAISLIVYLVVVPLIWIASFLALVGVCIMSICAFMALGISFLGACIPGPHAETSEDWTVFLTQMLYSVWQLILFGRETLLEVPCLRSDKKP